MNVSKWGVMPDTFWSFFSGLHHNEEVLQRNQLALVREMISPVMGCPEFFDLPASRAGKHHAFRGGLAYHTLEVLHLCVAESEAYHRITGRYPDIVALLVGATWHDYGKKGEYRIVNKRKRGEKYAAGDVVRRQPYGHHITLGAMEFGKELQAHPSWQESCAPGTVEHIMHLIESHHGRKDWGSPQEPRTPEAMILHHADMLSVMADSGDNPTARP